MDAKPQRIRVRGDENAPPLQQSKSLHHQRNKSMSALNSSVAAVARNTTRRAFGDVSNTKDQRAARDDSALVEKPTLQATEKPALSQPAQRPASVAGTKGRLNTVLTKPVNPAGKAQTKTTKRNNVVFRDSENLEPVIEKEASKESATAVRREPAVEEQAKSKEVEKVGKVDSASASGKKEVNIASTVSSKENVSTIDKLETDEVDDASAAAVSIRNSMPNLSQPEDDWDEDDTSSHFPHSDNTTGGLTTVVFPKYSAQTRHEILQATEMVEATRTDEDIMEDFYDTSMVAEYTNEIFLFMRQKEVAMLPIPNYMENQAEIQWSMRAVLMDWLVQVHFRFNLLPETLYLCVNYIDRFLSNKIVSLGKLQLVGATALYIAAKYEEVTPPSIHDIVYMVDGGYSADEIFKAERFMLGILHFELGWPGPMSFLRRISKADDYDLETRTVAKYFIELTIMDERFVSTPPSFAAAAAHCLALLMLHKGVWTASHACYSGYIYRQLYDTLVILVDCCGSPQTHHQAIFEKYMDRRFKRASAFVEAEIHRKFTVPLPVSDDNQGRYDGTANF